MKTPGELLSELFKAPPEKREEKRIEFEQATKQDLERRVAPGTKVEVSFEFGDESES